MTGLRPMRRCTAAWLLAVGALAAPRAAWALADPSRAASDVRAALHDGDYRFCKAPRKPLSPEAENLCPHASAIPDCPGFVAACSREEPRIRRFDLPAWIEHAVVAVVTFVAWLVKWALLPGLAVVLLAWAIRGLSRWKRETPAVDSGPSDLEVGEPVVPDAETSLDDETLLARADEQAQRQAFGVAVELYMAASLASLDRRGALHLSRDRTNGEYVRACSEPASKEGLRALAREVDHLKFGGRPATAETTARAAAAARGIVRGLPVVLSVLLLSLCTGCGGGWPGEPHPGDDPAGHELLVDVLGRQGFRAGYLAGSLSSLPLPEPGERGPAIVVDLDRTPIDEETRAHLVEWVKAGGSLVLAGMPELWPHDLGATRVLGAADAAAGAPVKVVARRLLARGEGDPGTEDGEEEEDEPGAPMSGAVYALANEQGLLAQTAGVKVDEALERVAWLDDHTTYAAVLPLGRGWVTALATGELLTNAALARPGNAAVAMAILSSADRQEVRIAQPEDGVSPPSTPIAAVRRAGLGLGLVHALVAALLLFAACGTRLGPPLPDPPPARRAFVEHVEAVGSLYRQGGHAAHALAAYTRLVDQRLRARGGRGGTDVPALLASRSAVPVDVCRRIWGRAVAANVEAPAGDELGILKELASVYSLATDRER